MNGERRGRINTALLVILVVVAIASIAVMVWSTYRGNVSVTDRLMLHEQGDKLDVMAATSLIVAREARVVSDAQAVIIADLVRRVAALEAERR